MQWLLADQRRFIALALMITALPLLATGVPPLVDLPNHMSRYRIGLDYGTSPFFRQWFDFHWVLVGNLGVDLAVSGLARLLGLEAATRLVVLVIPLITVAGMIWVAREIHGRVPATAAFAFVFAYNYPLNFGFVNFTLSAGLALLAFGLWLRLGRLGRIGLRLALFVPIGFVVWLAHACGWGMLGIMVATAAFADAREQGRGWIAAGTLAFRDAAPLAVSLLPMLHWFGGDPLNAAATVFVFDPARKLGLLFQTLRNDSRPIDLGSVLLVWSFLAVAIVHRDLRFDRRLRWVAAAMSLVFLVMPAQLMGAFHSDMRLAPYVIALWALAVRPASDTRVARLAALIGLAFFAGRLGYQTESFLRLDHVQRAQLTALDHVPIGARVFGFARNGCDSDWAGDRLDHLNRMAIVRRQAFTNGTWPPPGSQTLLLHREMTRGYHDDGSQMFVPARCRFAAHQSVSGMLAVLPRDRFDYLWLIDLPPGWWPHRRWLKPVWQSANGALYRIMPAT